MGCRLYPALIRGRFDPVRWAADPNRRADHYDERGTIAPADDPDHRTRRGIRLAEGVARVISPPKTRAC